MGPSWESPPGRNDSGRGLRLGEGARYWKGGGPGWASRGTPQGGAMSTLTTHEQGGQQPQRYHRPLHPVPLTRTCVCPSSPQSWGLWMGGRGTGAEWGWRGKGKRQPERQSDTSRLCCWVENQGQVMRG